MRPIRFRVWDKHNKVMYFPDEIALTFYPDEFYHVENLAGKVIVQPEHAVLTQYTGFKDSQGIDICEGDVLLAEEEADEHQLVLWCGDDGYPAFDLFPGFDADGVNSLCHLYHASDHYKVVGNKFENPDLLGGSNVSDD